MDDIESAHEAMQVLNDDNCDVINITTLKMSYPECPNVFTPVRRHKKENRSSQTEDWLIQDYKYNGSANTNQEKNNGGAWFKKFGIVKGTLIKKCRNSSPNPMEYGHEQAIAELDFVLDSYNHGTVKKPGGKPKCFVRLLCRCFLFAYIEHLYLCSYTFRCQTAYFCSS